MVIAADELEGSYLSRALALREVELAGLSLMPAWPAGDHGVYIYLSVQAYQTFAGATSDCSDC